MTYIYQYGTDFTIPPEHIQEAYGALLQVTREKVERNAFHRYDEVDPESWKGLRDVLDVWDWDFNYGNLDEEVEKAGITSLLYTGEKEDDERMGELFRILAPFVETGSHICFYNDEGEHFRYYFTCGMVFHQEGEVVFPDTPRIPNFWSLPPAMQKVILDQIRKGDPDNAQ